MRTEAEIIASARPGRAFSNMTQFEIWASNRGCWDDCAHEDAETEKWCPISGVALLHDLTPAEWPPEQVVTERGSYEVIGDCTEYERRPDNDDGDPEPEPQPEPEMPGQVDMFSVFTDQIIERVESLERVS
jgi:hypothetical protein